MSLFIHNDNQKLLWNAISQSNLFKNLGNARESWFRLAIEQFYHKISGYYIEPNTLLKINKECIQEMINKLKSDSIKERPNPIRVDNTVSINSFEPANKSASRDFLLEQKQTEINTQFNNRIDQYNITPKTTPIANFKETQLDEPITNMEELIKQHMMERDQVMSYAIPPTNTPNKTQSLNSINPSTPILKIQEVIATSDVISDVIEFRIDDTPETISKTINSVHWTKDDSANATNALLMQKVDDMVEYLKQLKEELRNEIIKGFAELQSTKIP